LPVALLGLLFAVCSMSGLLLMTRRCKWGMKKTVLLDVENETVIFFEYLTEFARLI
jgi:hypothetical protein